MIDAATLAQVYGECAMPPDAGPDWRAAAEFGFDMSLVEDALQLTPEPRLDEHQQVLNFFLEIQAASELVN